MNARRKAKMYKGSYRYNLTVCKAYRIEIEGFKSRLNAVDNIAKDLSSDSAYWQELYYQNSSDEEYHNAVTILVKSRR